MNILKRLSCLLIAFTIFSPYAAYAENNIDDGIVTEGSITLFSEAEDGTEDDTEESAAEPLTAEEREVLVYIAERLSEFEPKIDLPAKYQTIKSERFMQIFSNNLVLKLLFEHPEAFFLSSFSYQVSVRTGTGVVTSVKPIYGITAEERDAAKAVIDTELNKITAPTEGMTDLQKVLYVHDYIVANYCYDTRVYSSNPAVASQANRMLDKMIADKKGVCQGYSYLFMAAMNRLGIECITVPTDVPEDILAEGEISDHMWNKVKLDGEWYNVDVTYDDPLSPLSDGLSDINLSISHSYFLQSDDDIVKEDLADDVDKAPVHRYIRATQWDDTPSVKSESEDYSDLALHNICGNTAYLDGKFYCINNENEICEISFEKNKLNKLIDSTKDYKWFVYGEKSQYRINLTSIVTYKNKLYINSPDKIYMVDPDKKELTEVYAHEKEDVSNTYFYGLRVTDDGLFAICLKDSGNNYIYDDHLTEIPIKEDDEEEDLSCEKPVISIDADTNEVTVSAPIPKKVAESGKPVKVWVAKYDEDGFMGFENVEFDEDGAASFTPEEDCRMVKAFIWSGVIPLSDAAELVLEADETPETEETEETL